MERPVQILTQDTFRSGHATAYDWLRAARECLAQIGEIPGTSNLGFLYVTDAFTDDLPDILDFFREKSGIDHWVGTVGIGICGTGHEYYEAPAIAAMVCGFPEDSFRVFPTVKDSLTEFALTNSRWYRAHASRFGIVHGDPRNPLTPQLVERLASELNDAFLVGGLSSSRSEYRQIAGQTTEGGVSGVLFSDAVPVASALTQGCSLIGERHVITAAQRNIIIRIDDRPALDVFLEEIGEILARDLAKVAGYIFAALPIAGSDTGDYLVRNLVGIDLKNKLLAVGEHLREGDPIMFCRRDGNSAREDLIRMLRDLRRRAPQPPKGGIYCSCLGRGRHLFGDESEELGIIRHELGDFPLVGFFANGEISHNRLYGYTGVLTLFL